MLIPNLKLFFAPESGTGTIEDKSLSTEDTIKLLGEDEPEEKIEIKEPPKEKKEVKEGEEETPEDKEKEEVTLEDEVEDELAEPTEEELELMIPVRKKEILAKYPTLFKDFPYLERAYYRDQQFTEYLPTIEDAKNAVEKADALDTIEENLSKGDTTQLLTKLKESDKEGFYRVVDNYLGNLLQADQAAFHHVLGQMINNTVLSMVQEAEKSKNETLKAAAQVLNQFVFGTSDFKETKPLSKPIVKTDEEERISEREKALVKRQYEGAQASLSQRVDNILRATIEGNIDPKGSMTEYIRKNAVREASEILMTAINTDKRFRLVLDKLWERAFENDFSQDSLEKIRSTYLSKAKTLLPGVIREARNNGLRGLGKRVREEKGSVEEPEEEIEETPKKSGKSTTQSTTSGQSIRDKAKAIPKGMRTLDFLMKD